MKLNNFTDLHTRAAIDHKDVVWAFIVDDFRDSTEGCIEYNSDRFAVYSKHGKLVEVIHVGNALRIESSDHDAAIEVAHRIIDPVNEWGKESDVYGKIFDPAVEPQFNAVYVSFFHSNTSDFKCCYNIEFEGKTYEGDFFLDMLDDEHYDGAWDDNPDRHTFYHTFSTDNGEGNRGIEIIVTFNGDGKFEYSDTLIESIDVYLWHRCDDGHIENYDTLDDADVYVVNTETQEIF